MPVTPLEIMLAKILANGAVIVGASILSLAAVVQGLLGVPIAGSIPLFIAARSCSCSPWRLSAASGDLCPDDAAVRAFGLAGHRHSVPSLRQHDADRTMPSWLQTIMQITPNTQFVAFHRLCFIAAPAWNWSGPNSPP